MANDILQADNSLNRLKKLSAILSERKRLLIVIHNHPDPDALASAFALRYLLQADFHLPIRYCLWTVSSDARERSDGA
jgi:nanoRNase/pAp phosphatase (c-di-AMP/oligoRNAs hydrolase)